jgi:hypothetical protein
VATGLEIIDSTMSVSETLEFSDAITAVDVPDVILGALTVIPVSGSGSNGRTVAIVAAARAAAANFSPT